MPNINDIIRLFDREIWLVASEHDGRRGGLIATFVTNASIVPEMPRMVVGIAKQHHTWGLIEASRSFMLHMLDESQLDLVWHFGLQSGHRMDKFAAADGITGSVASLTCRVEASLDIGDRTLYLAEVTAAELDSARSPLTIKRVLQLAPPERIQELRAGMDSDAAIDAAAIREWRAARHSH
jgi:flavin reductase (DIM6/NTAB) family NADH-FMN oxidoreductase RutF